jgi:hypothetical protein
MSMVCHISHQVREAFPLMMAGTAIMDIAKSSLDRVGLGTVGRQKKPGEPRVVGQPLRHSFRLVNRIGVDHDIEPRIPCSRIALMEDVQEVAEQGLGLTWSQAVEQRPGGQIEGPGPGVLLVLPRRHDGQLGAFGHPGTSHFGSQLDIQFVGKDHGLAVLELLEDRPDAGQSSHAVGSIIFGHQFGPLPHLAELVEPAAHGLGGDGDAALGLQRQGQCGTAPACAAPPIRPRMGLEQGQ